MDAGTEHRSRCKMTLLIFAVHFEYAYHLNNGAVGERKLGMKVSKDVMADHKELIIKVAARRFRERGFEPACGIVRAQRLQCRGIGEQDRGRRNAQHAAKCEGGKDRCAHFFWVSEASGCERPKV